MSDPKSKVKNWFKQGDVQAAVQWLQQNNQEEWCQAQLRELHLGEQNNEAVLPLMQSMAEQQSPEGLVSASILAFLQQDLSAAIGLAEQAIQLDPDLATAHNHLGRALQNSGQSGKATKAFKTAVRLDPDYAQAWHNLGHTRRSLGVMDEAVAHYRKAIAANRGYQSAWFNLAITLSVLEQHQQALDSFEQLLQINPNHVLAWVNKGLAYHVLGDHDQAIECYDRAMDLDPQLAMVYSYKGVLLNELQQTEQAIRCLNHAIQLDPNEIDAWCELCDVYEKVNDLPQAEQANQQALSLDPNHPTALIDAARIKKRKQAYAESLNFLDRIQVAALPIRKATEYWFERGDVLDKLQRHDEAFQAYTQANNLTKQSPRFQAIDPQAFAQRVAVIKAGLAASGPVEKPSIWQRITGKNQVEDSKELGSQLCFLVGFPRSGTTLMDTILSVHAKVHSIEEMPTIERVLQKIKADGQNVWDPTFKDSADWDGLRKLYWEQVDQHSTAEPDQWVIDKLPLRFLEAEFIRQLFPQAKFLFMQRHPADTILSNFMQNFVPTEAFVNFTSLADAVEVYTSCLDVWQAVRARLGSQLLEVKYEDLVKEPKPAVIKVCQFLQIRFSQAMLDKEQRLQSRERVSTNSYAQVAESINVKSVNRWLHYQSQFEPHLTQLQPHIKRLGY